MHRLDQIIDDVVGRLGAGEDVDAIRHDVARLQQPGLAFHESVDAAGVSLERAAGLGLEGRQRPLGPQVVVLEVHRREAGVVPAQAVPFPVAVDQPVLGDPVDLRGDGGGIGLEAGEDRLPAAEDIPADEPASRVEEKR